MTAPLYFAFDEVDAALLAARHQSVVVTADEKDVRRLEEAGFVLSPTCIEAFVRVPMDIAQLSRNQRKTIGKSMAAWTRAGLEMTLVDSRAFGIERFLDQIYYPIIAPAMYERGIAPHFANKSRVIRQLFEEDIRLAVIANSAQTIVGCAVLRRGVTDKRQQVLFGELPSGIWEEGLFYSLTPGLESCRRALLVHLSRAIGAEGTTWFSLGRELTWCQAAYSAVVSEKLRIADSVVAGFAERSDLYRFRLESDESMVLFQWLPRECSVVARLLGHPDASLQRLCDLLNQMQRS